MVSALAGIIAQYRGPADRVRCMAHIVNLVVQIILRQFDAPNKKNGSTRQDRDSGGRNEESDGDVDDAEDLDIGERDVGDRDGEDDVVDGIDDIETAMEEDMAKAVEHVKPVKEVLSKVRSHPHIVSSSLTTHLSTFYSFGLPSFAGWQIASRNPPRSPSLDGRRL